MSSAVEALNNPALAFQKAVFLFCPTGTYCREDRCQSFFDFELIPSMRAPLEECESAGAFKKVGLQHSLIDAPAEKLSDDEFLKEVLNLNPDLLIIGVTFGSLVQDLSWVKKLKSYLGGATIGIRGAPCYVWSQKLLAENPELDFCVQGDYEAVFEDIATKGTSSARGVTYRDITGAIRSNPAPLIQNLDVLPLPDRSGINPKLYKVRGFGKPQATIRVQRGCPFTCTYCLVHTVSGDKARHRSPESVASEMTSLMEQGIKHFYLRAETFSVNKKWAISLSKILAKKCQGARWVTTTRVECVDDDVIAAMKAGGCYGISFGVDVASKKIGELVKKVPRLEDAHEAMRLCDKHGIISLGYFMIGFIWDTEDTISETEAFIRDVRPDLLTIHFAHPYPGTRYYEDILGSVGKVVSLKAQAEPALATQSLSPVKLKSAARRMLVRHYSRPKVIYSLIKKGIKLL